MYPRKLTRSVISNPDYPVVETKYGKLRGLWEEDVFIFRGVQYAKAKRFHLPEAPDVWEGTKTAIIYGPVCPEIHTPIAHDEYNVPHYHYIQDEECHYLNIWTKHIERDAHRPVMVWIHGGGFSTGSSIELYAYDGHELADFDDVVVVSLNHRLNCLGYLNLSSFGEQYKYTGNMGQIDLIAALHWVRENIEAFGGDPNNVTIMGQSGGGGKVDALLQTPASAGLYHRAVIQSGLFEGSSDLLPEGSRLLGETVMEVLGFTDCPEKIETIPYYKLARAVQQAQEQLVGKVNGPMGMLCPTKDDEFYFGSGQCNPFVEANKHVPLLVGSVLGEFDQNYNNIYAPGSKNEWPEEMAVELVREVYGEHADAVMAALKKAYPGAKTADCLFINRGGRVAARNYAVKRRAEGCAPAYTWLFNLECPLNSGTIPWHNAEEAYMFHNANYLEASYIPGVSEQLQDEITGAWVAFAESGNPNHVGMPVWHETTEDNGACMIFDRVTREEYHHDDELMEAIPIKDVFPKNHKRKPGSRFGGGPRQSL